MDYAQLVAERHTKATPRGKDVRKMEKPYTCREVIFVCSNGWTIEKLPPEDHAVEGYFMGHCLGGPNTSEKTCTLFSLREPDGTPHVTIKDSLWSPLLWLFGRCNKFPKDKYVALVQEYATQFGKEISHANCWGQDDDEEYHEEGHWTDEDYRDLEFGSRWRDQAWRKKRGVEK